MQNSKKLQNIEIKKLTLKNINKNYFKWVNTKSINRYLEIRHKKQTKSDIKKFILSSNKSKNIYLFGIFVLKNNNHIGNIKLEISSIYHKRAEVGIMIGDKTVWGKGYGSEAILLIEKFAKKKLKLKKLFAGCYEDNIGSKKAFLKAKWKIEGVQKNFWRTSTKKRNSNILLGKSI